MIHLCPICTHTVDEYGDHVVYHDALPAAITTKVCIPCRLEAMRVKKAGVKTIPKKRDEYVRLPYKD